MKRHLWPGVLFLGFVLSAWAQADQGSQEMNCWFKHRAEFGKTADLTCSASLRVCDTRVPDGCKPGYQVICNGLRVFLGGEPTIQVIDQGGLGITQIGEEGGTPYLAVDAALFMPFERAFAHLYLTPFDRLSGECTSHIGSLGQE